MRQRKNKCSEYIYFVIFISPAKPPVAQNFHEIQTTARTVTLGWTWQWPSSSSDKLFFRVSYRKNGETTWSRSGPFETRTKEYLLTGLDSETTYEMRLIAYNDEVEGDPSLSIAVRTNGQNDPVKGEFEDKDEIKFVNFFLSSSSIVAADSNDGLFDARGIHVGADRRRFSRRRRLFVLVSRKRRARLDTQANQRSHGLDVPAERFEA